MRVEHAGHGAADRHGREDARREDVIDDEADRDAREQQAEAERRLQPRRLVGGPACIAQQRNLLRDEARRRHAEQEEPQVQHPERRLAHRLLEGQPERLAGRRELARRNFGRRRLAQAVGDDGPAHEQHEQRDAEHGMTPAVRGDDRADHEHRQERAADADAGIRAAERQPSLRSNHGVTACR